MIEFHLDAHSGIAPYLQIVRQVRQALLLGLRSPEYPMLDANEVLNLNLRARCVTPGNRTVRSWHAAMPDGLPPLTEPRA